MMICSLFAGYSHEITQISCVCKNASKKEFNVYTLPMKRFDHMASVITGLTKRKNTLLLRVGIFLFNVVVC